MQITNTQMRPMFYLGFPVTTVTSKRLYFKKTLFLKNWLPGTHTQSITLLCVCVCCCCVWIWGPNQILLPWYRNYFYSASRYRCTATVPALSQLQLSRLPKPRRVVKEMSPGKQEAGAEKEVLESSQMHVSIWGDDLGKTQDRKRGDSVCCSL